MSLGLEGLGAPCRLSVAPSLALLAQPLALGAEARRTLTLDNTSDAPAHFAFEGGCGDGSCEQGNETSTKCSLNRQKRQPESEKQMDKCVTVCHGSACTRACCLL